MDDSAEVPSRSAQTQQRILWAAAEEVLANGYAATSLAAIASRLGLTKGALARHVPVKTSLIEELSHHLHGVLERCDAGARAVFPDSPSRSCVTLMVNVGFVAAEDVLTAAGIAMAFDPSVPTGSSGSFVYGWIDLLSAHLKEMSAREGYELNAAVEDAAEFLTAALTGMWVTGRFVPAGGRPRLQLTELALVGVGVPPAEVAVLVNDVLAAARRGALQAATPPEVIVPKQWWRGAELT